MTGAAIVAMTISTAAPFVRGFDPGVYDWAISWFFISFAITFVRFALLAGRRWNNVRTWSRLRTLNFAVAMVIFASDAARLRWEFGDQYVSTDASTLGTWLIRVYAGWSIVWFVGWFRPADPDHEEGAR